MSLLYSAFCFFSVCGQRKGGKVFFIGHIKEASSNDGWVKERKNFPFSLFYESSEKKHWWNAGSRGECNYKARKEERERETEPIHLGWANECQCDYQLLLLFLSLCEKKTRKRGKRISPLAAFALCVICFRPARENCRINCGGKVFSNCHGTWDVHLSG